MTRFIVAMALCAFALAPCAAQSFTSSPASPISNALPPTTDVITVSGGPISISTMKVVLDITHTWDADLDIFLLPPPALGLMPIELTTGNGGSSDDYTNTEFTGTGDPCLVASGPITGGSAPFTGLFNPEGDFDWNLLYGLDGNGDWTLEITDIFAGDDGTLNSWTIDFGPFATGNQLSATSTPALAIPDSDPMGATDTITFVCGPAAITALRVEINITHTFDGDLDIWLIPPGGMAPGIELSTDNGGSGDNYIGTVFTGSVDPCFGGSSITGGSAPFTGTFLPEDVLGFDALYGTPANGTWTLFIADDAGGDTGTLDSWSISFEQESSFIISQVTDMDLSVDIRCGTPATQFFSIYSFDPANGGGGLGAGPIVGLFIGINDLVYQLQIGATGMNPIGGTLDGAGNMFWSDVLGPGSGGLSGITVYGVAFEVSGPGLIIGDINYASHTFL